MPRVSWSSSPHSIPSPPGWRPTTRRCWPTWPTRAYCPGRGGGFVRLAAPSAHRVPTAREARPATPTRRRRTMLAVGDPNHIHVSGAMAAGAHWLCSSERARRCGGTSLRAATGCPIDRKAAGSTTVALYFLSPLATATNAQTIPAGDRASVLAREHAVGSTRRGRGRMDSPAGRCHSRGSLPNRCNRQQRARTLARRIDVHLIRTRITSTRYQRLAEMGVNREAG